MQQQNVAHTEAFVAEEGEEEENRVKVCWTQFKNGNDQEKPNAFIFNTIFFSENNFQIYIHTTKKG